MWWVLAAQAALGAAQSRTQSLQQAVNRNQQALDNYTQQTYQLMDMTAQGTAVVDANQKNIILSNYKAGLLSIQQAQALRQQASTGVSIREAGLAALGAGEATAAASGTVGASVRAVASDIRQQVQDALIQTEQNTEVTRLNFETQMHDLYQGLNNAIQIPAVGRAPRPISIDRGQSWGQALLTGIRGVASQYAMQNMNLGLGSPSSISGNGNAVGSFQGMTQLSGGTVVQS